MSWQAPDLLSQIFKTPEVHDSNVLGNFAGGFLAGKQTAAENADGAQDNEVGGGGASGDAEGGAKKPSWFQNWMQSTLQGHQMAQNYVGYQEAVTATKLKQAQTQGAILSNQGQQMALDWAQEDSGKLSDFFKQTNGSLDDIINYPMPDFRTMQAQNTILQAKQVAATTKVQQARANQQIQNDSNLAKLLNAGIQVRQRVDGRGVPYFHPDDVAAGMRQLDARSQTSQNGSPNATSAGSAPSLKPPGVGDVLNNYRFNGGNPAAEESWEPLYE
jgi:hypothetical protein